MIQLTSIKQQEGFEMKLLNEKSLLDSDLHSRQSSSFRFTHSGIQMNQLNFSSQKYLVNGTLYETDSSNDENRLFLHNDNGSLNALS